MAEYQLYTTGEGQQAFKASTPTKIRQSKVLVFVVYIYFKLVLGIEVGQIARKSTSIPHLINLLPVD